MATSLINKANLEIKVGSFSIGYAASLTDPLLVSRVQEYKRITGSRMQPLDRSEISTKIPSADFLASRKIDGEFNVLVFRDNQALMLNPGGTVRVGLPVLEEAAAILAAAGIKDALIAGELHVFHDEKRRERIHDVVRFARAPESIAEIERLHFAVFDLMEINGDATYSGFGATWQKITELFAKGQRIRPVPMSNAKNAGDVEALFKEHVEKDGAEGLVLRSESAGIFKVKPRHTLDAVIIGFTESTGDRAGMMHDLLLALRRQDGTLHVLCRVGGGFSDDLRRTLLADLKDRIVESEYAEVNSDHVAYQMVEPRIVVEISCLDLISQTTRGASINRMALDWDATAGIFRIVRRLPLVSVISPQFVRFRDDKKTAYADIRIDQVTAIVDVAFSDRDARQLTLPKSELLRREVFVKAAKGETMVRKFVLWKTNKEAVSAEHPAFVIHYTDFSPNRATPISRDVRVSNSRAQIDSLFEQLKEQNIKKGWEPVSGSSSAAAPVAPAPTGATKAKEAPGTKVTPDIMRPAIEDIPADAGSIGHVADAASVRSGKFFSAARLKETPATREAAEIIEVPELAPELEAPVAEQASADKKTNKKSTTKVMTESDSDEGVTPETPAASAGLDTQSASKKSAKASKAAKPETEVKPPKAAKKESADSAKNKVAGEKKATNAEPKTAPKKPKGEKK